MIALLLRVIRPVSAIVVKAFDVPPNPSSDFGIAGKTIAAFLADEIQRTIDKTGHFVDELERDEGIDLRLGMLIPMFIRQSEVQDVDVEVKGISVTKVFSFWTMLRQKQHIVTGDLIIVGKRIVIRSRTTGRHCAEVLFEADPGELHKACCEIARKLVEHVNPALFAISQVLEDKAARIIAFRSRVEREPTNPHAHFFLAASFDGEIREEAEEGLAEFSKALSLKNNYPEALLAKGVLLEEKGDYPRAEEAYEAALKLRPKFFAALVYMGKLLVGRGRESDGVPYLKKAAKYCPKSVGSLCKVAEQLLRVQEKKSAIALCRDALKIDGQSAVALDILSRAENEPSGTGHG